MNNAPYSARRQFTSLASAIVFAGLGFVWSVLPFATAIHGSYNAAPVAAVATLEPIVITAHRADPNVAVALNGNHHPSAF